MSELIRLYKKIIFIFILSGVLTFLKLIYLNSNFSYHKIQQVFFQMSTNNPYIVASVDSNISDYFNKNIEKNKINLFQKPHYKVLWDNTLRTVITVEYFLPKKIDYIDFTDKIESQILNNFSEKKRLELEELKKNKRLFSAFHMNINEEEENYVEYFHFETNSVSILYDNQPLYRTFIVFFVIFSILFISYDFYKNKRY